MVRIKLANFFKKSLPRLDIHLFGAVPAYPREARYAAVASSVRSMDTSLPFAAACWSQSVRTDDCDGRPPGYFNSVFDREQLALAYDNVNAYLEWIQGK
jgi:hypothetical protein